MISSPTHSSSRSSVRQFLGKFRGTVVNNVDVKQLGRIQVMVPEVSSMPLLHWALPCVPVGGNQLGIFSVPIPGAGVWVEFEQGDPDYPIWTGCFYGSSAEVPARAREIVAPIPAITLQTPAQNSLVITDFPGPTGGIQLRTTAGAMISVTDVGITITNGRGATISLVGNTVDVNNGALTVM